MQLEKTLFTSFYHGNCSIKLFPFGLVWHLANVGICLHCKSALGAKSILIGNYYALGLERKIAYISQSPSDN